MLIRTTERTYKAIVLLYTSNKPKTHNLGKVKRYSKRFSEELEGGFPYNTPEEKHLFDLLKRGYIDTQYKDHYEITAESWRLRSSLNIHYPSARENGFGIKRVW
ncbi:MAG TPA: hypothetical protein VK563_00205 [Puia sp.]|nr:hypothetical protein [Puia sp.]